MSADGRLRMLSRPAAMGGVTRHYYDGDQEIMETDNVGGGFEIGLANTTRRYLRLPGPRAKARRLKIDRLRGRVDEVFLMIDYTLNSGCTDATPTSYAACERWAHQDRLGSVVSVSDSTGAMVEEYRYSPYGVSGTEGTSGFPFRFTGQRIDAATGLYYYKARFYDPETGRFLQTDPIGYEDQMNMYTYVGNDPVNATDPTGEFANILIGGAIGAVVGAAIEKVTNPNATRESIARAAAVGAAAGALGPAGGTAVRAALVGKAAASASKVSKAIPSGKALVTTTDLAADVVGQPVLGAVDAALQGQDPALGALEGTGAAGGAALAEAGTAGGGSTTRGKAGARGAAAALGKVVAKQLVKAGASKAGSNTSEQETRPPVDEDLEN